MPCNTYCCVPQCSSKRIDGRSFHVFPKDLKLKKKWVISLRIGKRVSPTMAVCSRHFLPKDFIPRVEGTTIRRPRLKNTAVPSQCLPTRSHDKTIRNHAQRLKWLKCREAECPNQDVSDQEELSVPPNAVTATDALNILATVCAEELQKTVTSQVVVNSDLSNKIVQLPPSSLTKFTNFSVMDITTDKDNLNLFTGVGTIGLFNEIVIWTEKLLQPHFFHFSVKGMVLLILVKMKLNLSFAVLSVLFSIPPTSCKRYFQQVLPAVTEVLKSCIVWPEKDELLKSMPQCFQKHKDVSVILDGTEISVEKCKCLRCRILTYSHYKGCNTVKFLVGVSPAGLITFISNGYGGRASDKFITLDSKILDKLLPFRDAVMVDKGFYIDEECANRSIALYRPAFVHGGKPLSKKDSVQSTNIAKARVHVERAIQRLKIFKVFREKLDWFMLRHIDDLMVIAAGIVNLSSPILGNDKF